jgi:drug/metabolite transporter (DMT)-like permease
VTGPVGAVRILGYLLLAAGVATLVAAFVRGDDVNTSGFVPGVAIGYLLSALAGLTSIAINPVRDGRYGPLAVLALVAAWLTGSTCALLWLPAGWSHDVPMGTIFGLLILLGVLLTWLAVYLMLFVTFVGAVAWLVDRIPALRRRGVGDAIRQRGHAGWWGWWG